MPNAEIATTHPVAADVARIPQRRNAEDDISLALDADRFAQMQRIATVMASGSLLPDHLVVRPFWATGKGQIHAQAYQAALKDLGEEIFNRSLKDADKRTMANCFRVVNQAFRWRMDPFSIIDKTYSVGDGKLAYEGQLVAAVINTRAHLKERLRYEYSGKEYTDERTITVIGTFPSEDEPRKSRVNVGRAKTNNAIWTNDPDQKLIYSGAIKWARAHCPELMLGVVTDDDLERMQMNVIEVPADDGGPAQITAADLKAKAEEPQAEEDVAEVDEAAQQTEDSGQRADNEELVTRIEGHIETEYGAKATGPAAVELTQILRTANLIGPKQSWYEISGGSWDDVETVLDRGSWAKGGK